jgi:pimeloyl-ACP methyl ester carboxylesterase
MNAEYRALEVVQLGPPSQTQVTRPILFVHGARHAAWCWQEYFLPYFAARGFAAWALSFRGHGGSAGRAQLASYTLDDYMEDVTHVLTQLPAGAVVVGHSLGGAVIQRLLATRRVQLRAAVLMASIPPDGIRRRDRLRIALLRRRDRDRFMQHLQGQPVPLPDHIFFSKSVPAADRARFAAQIQPESPRIQQDIHRPIVSVAPTPRPPLLVLGAGRDWFLSRGAVRRTARFYRTRPIFFRGMAHDMMLEPKWREVADTIIRFLETLP